MPVAGTTGGWRTTSSSGRLIRHIRLLTLTVGLAMLVAIVWNNVAQSRAEQRRALDADLTVEATVQSTELSDYFSRSRDVALLVAKNTALETFYETGNDRLDTIRNAGPVMADVNEALAFIEELYPGQISEVCFIDVNGAENARVVDQQSAAPDDLSLDESANPFFAPTVAARPGEVIQSAPYRSPDTGQWVISNSTPVVLDDGSIPAMIHFEVSMDSFREESIAFTPDHRTLVLDGTTGAVFIDTSLSDLPEVPGSASGDGPFRVLVESGLPAGLVTIDGERIAYERVDGGQQNENDWLVAISEGTDASVGGWTANQIAVTLLALVLVGLAVWLMIINERNLRRAANTDVLTGLANRRAFDAALDAMVRTFANQAGALMLLDLDDFKAVNDTYGHHRGDELLSEVANRLRSSIGAVGMVARVGGDEFGVLMPAVSSHEDADAYAVRISSALRPPVRLGDADVLVGASIGVALVSEHGRDVEALLRAADAAMYSAKAVRLGPSPTSDVPTSPQTL
jgi:diguanylate cyclase (GGDEF)-like protein